MNWDLLFRSRPESGAATTVIRDSDTSKASAIHIPATPSFYRRRSSHRTAVTQQYVACEMVRIRFNATKDTRLENTAAAVVE